MNQRDVGADSISARQCGITLIALVVTIVVMLILAGVSINMLFSDNGIIKKAQEASNKMNEATQNDLTNLNELYNQLDNVINDNNKPTLPSDGSYSEEKGVNTPKLGAGMVPVKWDEIAQSWIVSKSNDLTWYDYNNKQWANVMLTDGLVVEGIANSSTVTIAEMVGKKVTTVGSMFVWIPRYAYSIANNYHTNSSTGGTINVEFMKGTTNTSSTGRTSYNNASGQGNWNIHPAFNYGGEVAGIWVAKFEASRNNASYNSQGSENTMKIQPTVKSWDAIAMNEMYSVCINYNTILNSHLIKNVEWGACAYLSKSKYGKEEVEVGVNECDQIVTGMGPGGTAEITGGLYGYNIKYVYNTVQGQKASTTGNIYGIYDMSGGKMDCVAAYVDYVSNYYLQTYGTNLVNGEAKNKDVYKIGSGNSQQDNENANSEKYGDAVYETKEWFEDFPNFPDSSNPFFARGRYYSSNTQAGVFSFDYSYGSASTNRTFRPVLCVM